MRVGVRVCVTVHVPACMCACVWVITVYLLLPRTIIFYWLTTALASAKFVGKHSQRDLNSY